MPNAAPKTSVIGHEVKVAQYRGAAATIRCSCGWEQVVGHRNAVSNPIRQHLDGAVAAGAVTVDIGRPSR